jgi:hypothetical protein
MIKIALFINTPVAYLFSCDCYTVPEWKLPSWEGAGEYYILKFRK